MYFDVAKMEVKNECCKVESRVAEEIIRNDTCDGQCEIIRLNKTKSKKKERKVLHPQAKEIIVNVVNFMKQEACGQFVIPARKVQCRAAMATGFSERTVRRVIKHAKLLLGAVADGKMAGGGVGMISFPPNKTPKRPKPKTGLDEMTRCAVRKIIHKIYVNEKTVPTIKMIHQKLIDEIGFKGGSRSAHKIVKELGFYWKKTKSKSFVLIEKHEIRLKRIEYLREIGAYRRDGRSIVYVGEIEILQDVGTNGVLVHAGGETTGLLLNKPSVLTCADELLVWTRRVLLPTLRPRTVVVFDIAAFNAISGNSSSNSLPITADSPMEEMREWLSSKSIPFDDEMLRPELHQLIKRNTSRIRKQKQSVLESVLTEQGHVVTRIPAHHPDLNPIDVLWWQTAAAVSDAKSGKKLCKQWVAIVDPSCWQAQCLRVRQVEQQYLENESIIDVHVERVMAKPAVAAVSAPTAMALKANTQLDSTAPSSITNCNHNHSSLHTYNHQHHSHAAVTSTAVGSNNDDDQQDNINFVRHFMGGLLGLPQQDAENAKSFAE